MRPVLGAPDEVRCNIWTQNHNTEGEDPGCALRRYADRAVLSLYATTCYTQPTSYFELELHDTEGAVSLARGGRSAKSVNATTSTERGQMSRQTR